VVRPVAGVGCSWKRKKSFAEEGGRERERDEGGWASNCGVDCSGKDGGESGGG